MSKLNQELKEIYQDNLPPFFVHFIWVHPEYGEIKGYLIETHAGRIDSRPIKGIWVHPADHSADISVEEFTHYKSL